MVFTRDVLKQMGEVLPGCADKKAIKRTLDESGNTVEWIAEEFLTVKLKNVHKYKFVLQGGYLDDQKYILPYRHITNWFFARKTDKPKGNSLTTLPNDHVMRNMVVFGDMEPNTQNKVINKDNMDLKNVKIFIRHPISWTLDRSHDGMGYWVQTKLAWYYLKQPEKVLKCPRSICRQISMEKLFLPHRALLGLLANIIDMLGETHNQEREDEFPYYASVYRNKTPEECHAMLCPSEEILAENEGLNEEPFDLDFLQREGAGFVHKHLIKVFKDLDRKCRFMMGLKRLERILELSKKQKEYESITLEEYESTALAAEARSRRTPWGEKKEFSTRINKLLEIQGGTRQVSVETNHNYLQEQIRIQEKMKQQQKLAEERKTNNQDIIELLEDDSDESSDDDDSDIEFLCVKHDPQDNNSKTEDPIVKPENVASSNTTLMRTTDNVSTIHPNKRSEIKQENISMDTDTKRQKMQVEETTARKITMTEAWDAIEQCRSSAKNIERFAKQEKRRIRDTTESCDSNVLQHIGLEGEETLRKFREDWRKHMGFHFDNYEREYNNMDHCSD